MKKMMMLVAMLTMVFMGSMNVHAFNISEVTEVFTGKETAEEKFVKEKKQDLINYFEESGHKSKISMFSEVSTLYSDERNFITCVYDIKVDGIKAEYVIEYSVDRFNDIETTGNYIRRHNMQYTRDEFTTFVHNYY